MSNVANRRCNNAFIKRTALIALLLIILSAELLNSVIDAVIEYSPQQPS